MAQNEVQLGRRIDFTLTAPVSSGELVAIGKVVGVAQTSGNIGDTVAVAVQGVWRVASDGSAFAVGDQVAFAAGQASTTGTIANIGICTQAATGGSASVAVLFTPGSGV